jgi:hypothetical protein
MFGMFKNFLTVNFVQLNHSPFYSIQYTVYSILKTSLLSLNQFCHDIVMIISFYMRLFSTHNIFFLIIFLQRKIT